VAKMLAEKLGFERISAGNIQRKIADQKGMSLMELLRVEETDSSIDEEVDKLVEDMGKTKDNFIIEGRTAFHFIPESLKIFLKVDLAEGAKRIFADLEKEERKEEDKMKSAKDLAKKLNERLEIDRERYQKYYGVDYTDESNYDLVIDSSKITAQNVAEKIMVEVEKLRENEERNVIKDNTF
jgi:cytidylate kinase